MQWLNPRDARRMALAWMLATLIATGGVVFADGIYIRTPSIRKWCETASNFAYIVAGCWRY